MEKLIIRLLPLLITYMSFGHAQALDTPALELDLLIKTVERVRFNASANEVRSTFLKNCFLETPEDLNLSVEELETFKETCEPEKDLVRHKLADLLPKMKVALALSSFRMQPEAPAFAFDERYSWVYKIKPHPSHPHHNIATRSFEWVTSFFTDDLQMAPLERLADEGCQIHEDDRCYSELDYAKKLYRADNQTLESNFREERSEFVTQIEERIEQLNLGFFEGLENPSDYELEYYKNYYEEQYKDALHSFALYKRYDLQKQYKDRYMQLVSQAPFLLFVNNANPSDETLAKAFKQIAQNAKDNFEKITEDFRDILTRHQEKLEKGDSRSANEWAVKKLLHYIAFKPPLMQVLAEETELQDTAERLDSRFQRQEMYKTAIEAGGLITLHVASFILSGGTSLVLNLFLGAVDIGYLAYTSTGYLEARSYLASTPLGNDAIADINQLDTESKSLLLMSILTPIGVVGSARAVVQGLKPETRVAIRSRWQSLVDSRSRTPVKRPGANDVVGQIETKFRSRIHDIQTGSRDAVQTFLRSHDEATYKEMAQEIVDEMEKVQKPFRWGVHDEAWGSQVSTRQLLRRNLGRFGNQIPEFPAKYLLDNTIVIAEELSSGARGFLIAERRAQADALIESFFKKQGTSVPENLTGAQIQEISVYARSLDDLPIEELPEGMRRAMDQYRAAPAKIAPLDGGMASFEHLLRARISKKYYQQVKTWIERNGNELQARYLNGHTFQDSDQMIEELAKRIEDGSIRLDNDFFPDFIRADEDFFLDTVDIYFDNLAKQQVKTQFDDWMTFMHDFPQELHKRLSQYVVHRLRHARLIEEEAKMISEAGARRIQVPSKNIDSGEGLVEIQIRNRDHLTRLIKDEEMALDSIVGTPNSGGIASFLAEAHRIRTRLEIVARYTFDGNQPGLARSIYQRVQNADLPKAGLNIVEREELKQSVLIVIQGAEKSADKFHGAAQGAVILMPTRSVARALSLNENQLSRSVSFMRWGVGSGGGGAIVGLPMMFVGLIGTHQHAELKTELEETMLTGSEEEFEQSFVQYCLHFVDACSQARTALRAPLLSQMEKTEIINSMWGEDVILLAEQWRAKRASYQLEQDVSQVLETELLERLRIHNESQ